jgi:hypothetical protein
MGDNLAAGVSADLLAEVEGLRRKVEGVAKGQSERCKGKKRIYEQKYSVKIESCL